MPFRPDIDIPIRIVHYQVFGLIGPIDFPCAEVTGFFEQMHFDMNPGIETFHLGQQSLESIQAFGANSYYDYHIWIHRRLVLLVNNQYSPFKIPKMEQDQNYR